LGRRLVLVTNSHPETLRIKDRKVGIQPFLDVMYSSQQFGVPKEDPQFWDRFRAVEPYAPGRTAFIDDNPAVLAAARHAGIGTVIAVTNPDSTRPPREPPAGYLHVAAVLQIE
jgi:5'-nucleotidase